MNTVTRPIAARLYRQRIAPAHYTLPPALAGKVRALYDVWVYDASLSVNCCEITPSYELHHAYATADTTAEYDHERDGEALGDWLNECEACTDNIAYRHCRSIDNAATVPAGSDREIESIDDVIEHERANRRY